MRCDTEGTDEVPGERMHGACSRTKVFPLESEPVSRPWFRPGESLRLVLESSRLLGSATGCQRRDDAHGEARWWNLSRDWFHFGTNNIRLLGSCTSWFTSARRRVGLAAGEIPMQGEQHSFLTDPASRCVAPVQPKKTPSLSFCSSDFSSQQLCQSPSADHFGNNIEQESREAPSRGHSIALMQNNTFPIPEPPSSSASTEAEAVCALYSGSTETHQRGAQEKRGL